jgi:type I restriction-modification system DNA methylase subunit
MLPLLWKSISRYSSRINFHIVLEGQESNYRTVGMCKMNMVIKKYEIAYPFRSINGLQYLDAQSIANELLGMCDSSATRS